jgi:alpha-ketoglutarate-dependent taurine dioxygenase
LILKPTKNESSKADYIAWAENNKAALAAELAKYGAIVFRGFPFTTPQDFSDFVEALGAKPLPYVGGAAVRYTVYKDVHTTNESPPDQKIPFHHEMAQVPKFPQQLFFFCEVAPAKSGETSIMKSDIAYEMIKEVKPEFCQKLEEHGVIYTRYIPGEDDPTSPVGRGWRSTFAAKDKETAEKHATNLGVSLEWLPNGDVKTVSPVLPAIKTLKINKKVWFNSIIAAYTGCEDSRNDPKKSVSFGNGEYLNDDDVQAAVKIMEEHHVDLPWKEGDVMWIDNHQVLHSRAPNFPLPRKILAYLGENCPY